MIFSTAVVAAVFASSVSAFNVADHVYQAPSGGDLRGPCPGLNTYVCLNLFET
jgi:hypothetical protein